MNAPLAKDQIALLMADTLTYREPVVQGTDGTVAEPRPSVLARAGQWLVSALAAAIEVPRRRAVIDELNMLSDRELADIGLARAELGRVFEPGFTTRH